MPRIIAAIVIGLILARVAVAQTGVDPIPIDSLKPGAEIRVWSNYPTLSGSKFEYVAVSDSILTVREKPGGDLIGFGPRVSMSHVQRLEARGPRRRSLAYFGSRLLVGAGAGMAIGGTLGLMSGGEDGMGPLVGVAGGFVLGAVAGGAYSLKGGPTWVEVRYSR